jgi:hypothetical protein
VAFAQVCERGAVSADERASPNENGADGARSVMIGDTDKASGRGLVDGHFRADGNAYAGANHGEKTGRMSTFKNDARVQASPVADGDSRVAKAVSVTQKEKRIEAKIGELKRVAVSELVILGKSGEETLRKEGNAWNSLPRTGRARTARSMEPARRRSTSNSPWPKRLLPFFSARIAGVGVGIMIAHNPLHGSGRADFPYEVCSSTLHALCGPPSYVASGL